MDSELKQDLLEAFDGLDPLELLSNDPTVTSLIQEIEKDPNFLTEHQKNTLVAESVTSPSAFKSDPEQNSKSGLLNVKVKPNGDRSSKSGPCSICKGLSKGKKYYGATACTGCRAFFYRSYKGGVYKTFHCENLESQNGCSINSKSWIRCRFCRFKQCLAAGMIIPVEEKICHHADFDCAANEPRQSARKLGVIWVNDELLSRMRNLLLPSTFITSEEKFKLEKYSSYFVDIGLKVMSQLTRSNADVFLKQMEYFYYGEIYPMPLKKTVDDCTLFCGTEYYLRPEGPLGAELKPSDRFKLVANNIPLVIEYFVASKLGTRLADECHLSYNTKSYLQALSQDQDEDFQTKIKSIYCQVTKHKELTHVS